MRILRAKALGLCFGVRDALALADRIPHPQETAILGELVHNEQVLHQLELRGFHSISETRRDAIPERPEVLITAHGISDVRREGLLSAGKILHDTTCPLVANVHRAARRLVAEERHVIVIGRPSHVEVQGVVEDLASYSVFARPEDVSPTGATKLGVISQSTTSPTVAAAVRRRIVELHPNADIHWFDTICQPTKDRQQAVQELLPQIDALIVVGGARSNNSQALAELARAAGIRVFHVQSASDLQRAWFAADDRIGLTAGTSTPDETTNAVAAVLESWAAAERPFLLEDQELAE